jgi:hypothetical protein
MIYNTKIAYQNGNRQWHPARGEDIPRILGIEAEEFMSAYTAVTGAEGLMYLEGPSVKIARLPGMITNIMPSGQRATLSMPAWPNVLFEAQKAEQHSIDEILEELRNASQLAWHNDPTIGMLTLGAPKITVGFDGHTHTISHPYLLRCNLSDKPNSVGIYIK